MRYLFILKITQIMSDVTDAELHMLAGLKTRIVPLHKEREHSEQYWVPFYDITVHLILQRT